MCFSGVSSPPPALNVLSTINQQQGEIDATQFLNGLPLLNPTTECLEELTPFICLHIFGLCDTSGNLHTSLRGDCLKIRDSVCPSQWAVAMSVLPPGTLPVCEDLPDVTEECIGEYMSMLAYYNTNMGLFCVVYKKHN